MNASARTTTTPKLCICTLAAFLLLTFLPQPTQAAPPPSGCILERVGAAKVKSWPETYRTSDVWLYGDSITWQTFRHLRATSDLRWAVDAHWGRDTASAVQALGKDVHRHGHRLPEAVVMAVGTNDLTNLNAFRRQVLLARAVLPRSVKLVWVNTYAETTNQWNAANRILRRAPGVRVVSWSGAALGKGLLRDGIHVNAAGCVVRNALIRKAVR